MKQSIVLSICILLLSGNNLIFPAEAVVLVTGGIHLREAPGSNAKSLGLIPSGTKVSVTGKSDTSITVDRLTDNWCSVKMERKVGWVFCAYIGSFYQSGECRDGIKSYLPPEAEITKVTKSEKVANPPYFSVGDSRTKITRYKNGIVHTEIMMYEGSRDTYFIPGGNLYEAYLIAKQCYMTEKSWQELQVIDGKIILSNDPNVHYLIRKTKDGVEVQTEFWT